MMTSAVDVTQSAKPHRRAARVVGAVAIITALAALVGMLGWATWHHGGTNGFSNVRTGPLVSGRLILEGGPIGTTGTASRPLIHIRVVVAGTSTSGVHITRHITTNQLGRVQLHLPAGHYVVAVGRKLKTPLDHQTHTRIVVRSHRPTHFRIVEAAL